MVCGIMIKYYNPLDFIISTSMLRENRMFIPWKMWYPIVRHIPIQAQIYPSISKYHHNIIIGTDCTNPTRAEYWSHLEVFRACCPQRRGARNRRFEGLPWLWDGCFFFHVYLQIVLKSDKSTREIQRYPRQTWIEWLIFSELEAVAGPTYPIFVVSTMAI